MEYLSVRMPNCLKNAANYAIRFRNAEGNFYLGNDFIDCRFVFSSGCLWIPSRATAKAIAESEMKSKEWRLPIKGYTIIKVTPLRWEHEVMSFIRETIASLSIE